MQYGDDSMSGGAASPAHTNSKSSRFSTLKVFGFQPKDKGNKPPPLPPKDNNYYLNPNRSYTSLSVPDFLPGSPSPSQHGFRYAATGSSTLINPTGMNPNQSSISLVSTAASAKSSVAPPGSQHAPAKKRSFFRFGKRGSKSSPHKTPDDAYTRPPTPEDDDSISMPWNFQHNIHVDEGFVGLPPSWMVQLREAGFSEDEIAAIQARRAANSRAATTYSNERPLSPAIVTSSNPAHAGAPPSVITRPNPRTTSLPRQYTDSPPPQRPSPVPLNSSASAASLRSNKSGYTNRIPPPSIHSFTSNEDNTGTTRSNTNYSIDSSTHFSSEDHGQNVLDNRSLHSEPRAMSPDAPPRRPFHITNGSASPAVVSPPPAYTNSIYQTSNHLSTTLSKNGYSIDQKGQSLRTNSPPSPPASSNRDTIIAPRMPPMSNLGAVQNATATISTPKLNAAIDNAMSRFSQRDSQATVLGQSIGAGLGYRDERSEGAAPLREDEEEEGEDDDDASTNSKRLTALPPRLTLPRLSLHKTRDSSDLSAWSAALFSSFSEDDTAPPTGSSFLTPSKTGNSSSFSTSPAGGSSFAKSPLSSSSSMFDTSRVQSPLITSSLTTAFPPPPSSSITAMSPPSIPPSSALPPIPPLSTSAQKPTPTAKVIRLPPTKPPTTIITQGDSDEEEEVLPPPAAKPLHYGDKKSAHLTAKPSTKKGPSPSSFKWHGHDQEAEPQTAGPLWSELEGILKPDGNRQTQLYSAALSAYSPTIPVTPQVPKVDEEEDTDRFEEPLVSGKSISGFSDRRVSAIHISSQERQQRPLPVPKSPDNLQPPLAPQLRVEAPESTSPQSRPLSASSPSVSPTFTSSDYLDEMNNDNERDSVYLSAGDYMRADGQKSNRDSSRSSSSTLSNASTITGYTAPTIVRTVSIARRAGAFVINNKRGGPASPLPHTPATPASANTIVGVPAAGENPPTSPAFARLRHGDGSATPSPMHSPTLGPPRPPYSPSMMNTPIAGPSRTISTSDLQPGPSASLSSPSTRPLPPSSPLSSHFDSEEGSGSGSRSSSANSQDLQTTPITEADAESPFLSYYSGSSPLSAGLSAKQAVSPLPTTPGGTFIATQKHQALTSLTDTFGGVKEEEEEEQTGDEGLTRRSSIQIVQGDEGEEDEEGQYVYAYPRATGDQGQRPTIIINPVPEPTKQQQQPKELPLASSPPHLHRLNTQTSATRLASVSPVQRYRGWIHETVAPIEEFIDEAINPNDYYKDLREIAEGESGSVYAARMNCTTRALEKLKLPAHVKAKDREEIDINKERLVAIKCVAISPGETPTKVLDLQRELRLMRGMRTGANGSSASSANGRNNIRGGWCEYILTIDAVYVDLEEDSLWIRMELMERSLTDVLELIDAGLVIHERVMAGFTSDILSALNYLHAQHIAHRDVRSDNLLFNREGVLKLTDFSNAVQVTPQNSMRDDVVGVAYWQAPEMRSPPYDALKIDVWALGATVWEMAEAQPPFSATNQLDTRWPPLSRPEVYTKAFHEFLTLCSAPAATRPDPHQLLKNAFVSNACGRQVIKQLLVQSVAIERSMQDEDEDEDE